MMQVMKWWLAGVVVIGMVFVASARGGDVATARAAMSSVDDGAGRAAATSAMDIPVELQVTAVCDDTECQAHCWAVNTCEGVCRNNVCHCMFSRSRPCP